MTIEFKVDDNQKSMKVLTWDQIGIKDINNDGKQIKKIALTCRAGEAAILTVEKYTKIDDFNASDPSDITNYYVGEENTDIVKLLIREFSKGNNE